MVLSDGMCNGSASQTRSGHTSAPAPAEALWLRLLWSLLLPEAGKTGVESGSLLWARQTQVSQVCRVPAHIALSSASARTACDARAPPTTLQTCET